MNIKTSNKTSDSTNDFRRENVDDGNGYYISDLFIAAWADKWIVIAIAILFSILSIIYAISLPNIYRAETTVAPVSNKNVNSAISSQLGGLASLAGVSLGSGGTDKTTIALAVLRSKKFQMNLIREYRMLPDLLAASDWNSDSNEITYDHDVYEKETGRWLIESNSSNSDSPSLQEGVEKYKEILNINEEPRTGLVKLTIEHVSPYIAKDWLDKTIKELNEYMRSREKLEAQESIKYLNGQIQETNIADVKSVLFDLIEEQTKTLMFAEIRDEYIFQTIDPAIVPEKKVKPSRALICVFGFMLGIVIAAVVIIVRFLLNKNSTENRLERK